MILTCPACDTKYVVKDGAIPPQGRQVRCASCKHSWHQDPETAAVGTAVEDAPEPVGGPPPPPASPGEQPTAQVPADAALDQGIAGEPQPHPDIAAEEESPRGAVASDGTAAAAHGNETVAQPDLAVEPPAPEPWRTEPADPEPAASAEEEFIGYAPIAEEERPRRRWPLLLAVIILIIAAAAAFWFFAPASWKERAGIAAAGATPLQLMITTSDRQTIEPSGKEMVSISGRVINPTDREQRVPPIQAELRDKVTSRIVYRWTIAPPARVLGPRSSASFNSAEVDVPKGGDELTVTLGGAAS